MSGFRERGGLLTDFKRNYCTSLKETVEFLAESRIDIRINQITEDQFICLKYIQNHPSSQAHYHEVVQPLATASLMGLLHLADRYRASEKNVLSRTVVNFVKKSNSRKIIETLSKEQFTDEELQKNLRELKQHSRGHDGISKLKLAIHDALKIHFLDLSIESASTRIEGTDRTRTFRQVEYLLDKNEPIPLINIYDELIDLPQEQEFFDELGTVNNIDSETLPSEDLESVEI